MISSRTRTGTATWNSVGRLQRCSVRFFSILNARQWSLVPAFRLTLAKANSTSTAGAILKIPLLHQHQAYSQDIRRFYRTESIRPEQFDPIFLRDSCTCPRCVDQSTSQKIFETAAIPLSIDFADIENLDGGETSIRWKDDIPGYEDHRSTFSEEFLKTQVDLKSRMQASHNDISRTLWDRQIMSENTLTLDYEAWMNDDCTLYTGLSHLRQYGLIFLKNCPWGPDTMEGMATRMGPLRNTFYGSKWDVRAVPSAKNVAYTSVHLDFHQDLLYMTDPPGFQFLHCIKSSTNGGESLFTDAFRAVDHMDPSHSNPTSSFASFPVTYQYNNDGQWYQRTRPTLEYMDNVYSTTLPVNALSNPPKQVLQAVNWGPPFQAPFDRGLDGANETRANESRLRDYIKGAKAFKELIENEDNIYETKMSEGVCSVFDNRRILHARRAFSSEGGERWLRGAYVDTDAFRSRLRVLDERYRTL